MISIIDDNFVQLPPLKGCAAILSSCEERVHLIGITTLARLSEIKQAVLESWSESIREQAKRIQEELSSSAYLSHMAYLKILLEPKVHTNF